MLLSNHATAAAPTHNPFSGAPPGFTLRQAARGKALYDANCGACHGVDLNGGQSGPPLRGAPFQSHWATQPADSLFSFIWTNMPPTGQGALNRAAYSAIDAYLLRANGAAAGSIELVATQAPPPRPMVGGENFARPEANQDLTYEQETARKSALLAHLRTVTDEMLNHPPAADWIVWRGTYSSLGFSPLEQINTRNVNQLSVAWSWALHPSANEITPLVHDGVLFIQSGDAIQAFDAARGDLLWQYLRSLPEAQNGGRSARSKGIAVYGNAVYAPTVDGHVVALDARTGKLLWDREVLSPAETALGVALNGAPIVVKGKLIMGVALSLFLQGGCYIFALDTRTGEETWRFHTIAWPGQPGGDSWNGLPVNQRYGGAVWTAGSYDPALNLLYFGTGNTYDTAALLRPPADPGKSNAGLFTESTVALNPDSGNLVWYYQHMRRDVWDMDWTFEQSLIDLPLDGHVRKLLVTGGKMALFDAIDRANGTYAFSRDVGLQNIVMGIEPHTGDKKINPALAPMPGEKKLICPGAEGVRNWPATSYNPQTHILYVPMVEACADFTWIPRDPSQSTAGGIDQRFRMRPAPHTDGKFGRIEAINLQTGKVVWTDRQRAPISGAMLATAGGIVFNGARDRYFRAYDQVDGTMLWQMRLDAAASSFPITYSVDGVQYVAVVAGGGNPHDVGWAPLTPEITNPTGSTTLWVFRLPSGSRSRSSARGIPN